MEPRGGIARIGDAVPCARCNECVALGAKTCGTELSVSVSSPSMTNSTASAPLLGSERLLPPPGTTSMMYCEKVSLKPDSGRARTRARLFPEWQVARHDVAHDTLWDHRIGVGEYGPIRNKRGLTWHASARREVGSFRHCRSLQSCGSDAERPRLLPARHCLGDLGMERPAHPRASRACQGPAARRQRTAWIDHQCLEPYVATIATFSGALRRASDCARDARRVPMHRPVRRRAQRSGRARSWWSASR